MLRKNVYKYRVLLLAAAMFTVLSPTGATGEPMAFDKYYMVFLYRGDNPPQLDADASRKLQAAHIEHLTRLWKDGHALVAGPFGGDADEPLRGIVLLHGQMEIDKARELAEADPAVRAGRLKVKILPWFTEAGVMQFPKPRPSE